MEENDYTRTISIIFMAVGFGLAMLGFYFAQSLFYIAIGWELASFLIVILMQKSVFNAINRRHEFRKLKRNTKFAVETQNQIDSRIVSEVEQTLID